MVQIFPAYRLAALLLPEVCGLCDEQKGYITVHVGNIIFVQ
jgi:hypothetical protein